MSFRGDYKWIHRWEGHMGKPYWPGNPSNPKGNASGVTLDPGVDLGHVNSKLFEDNYGPHLSEKQLAACRGCYGLKGIKAYTYLQNNPTLQSIRISRDLAESLFPLVADPYWRSAVKRFDGLEDPRVPPEVHTAILSLCYNRGPSNKALGVLNEPIKQRDWFVLGETIGKMQQDHSLKGIRDRRKAEGQLIIEAANRVDHTWPVQIKRMTPKPLDPL
jgi:hypothetical protein